MTEETLTSAAPNPEAPIVVRRRIIRRPRSGLGWFVAGLMVLVLMVVGAGLVSRYGVLTPPGRALIEAQTSGLKLGRLGKLKIVGLNGDIWRDFTIRRLTVSDEKGVWLQADDLHLVWRSLELIHRRFHAEQLTARQVTVIRRPTLTEKTKSGALPVSFDIDSLKARVEFLPAFSSLRGLFDLSGNLDVERGGGAKGALAAASLLHAGDGLKADFDMGATKVVKLNADIVEAGGGALAGALGLAASEPFTVAAHANGTLDKGQFTLDSHSGKIEPLSGKGAWDANGGQADLQVLFAASRLTQGMVKGFGPQAKLAVSGRRAASGLYALDIDGRSENVALRATGPADLTKRTATGLALDIKVVDLKRLGASPEMKAGHFNGRLNVTAKDWKAKGQSTIGDLDFAGYHLATFQGPTEVASHNGALDISADLTGSGGSGSGWFSAWMGPRPRIAASLTRFSDKRFLIRTLSGEGAGLSLKGQGTRGILGGLDFSGDIKLSNLAVAHRGASGVLSGRWAMTQGGAGKPWRFTVDGRGDNFGSGYDQVDRLLGRQPRLKAEASLDQGAWSFSSSEVDGDKARVGAVGVLARDGGLKFTLDWRAKGPFRAGPVEIAGDVKGGGALTGTLGAPRADLEADIAAIDFPQLTVKPAHLTLSFLSKAGGGDGAIKLTGATAYGEAYARADFRYAEDGLDLSGIDARAGGVTALGSLALRGSSPSRADLTLTAGPGAFLAGGKANARVKIVDDRGGAQSSVRFDATGLRFKDSEVLVRSLTLSADGPTSNLPYLVSADVSLPQAPVKLTGSGVASERGAAWSVSFQGGGKVDRNDVRTLTPLVVNFGGPETTAAGAIAIGGGRADFKASQAGEVVGLDARVQGLDLSLLSEDLAGKVSGAIALSGRGPRLSGTMDASLLGARSRDGPAELAINGTVHAGLDQTKLTLEASATNSKGLHSTANAILPAETSAAPLRIAINRTKPISGRFDVDGELQPIWDLFFGGERSLGGRLVAQGALGGSINSPSFVGEANLSGGRFEDSATGLKLTGVSIAADLHQDKVVIRQFAGADGRGGTVSGSGQVGLDRGGSSTFTLKANRFMLLDNDLAEATASGDLTVTRAADGKAKLSGALVIDRADIVAKPPTPSGVVTMEVVERNRPADRPDAFKPPTARGPSVTLDVKLTAPRRIFIKGRGLDAELSLDAHVGGTTARPELDGTARVFRGAYQFAGKRFEFDERGAVYLATSPDRIRLDLSATRDDPSLTAVVKITGTAAKPEIALTSTPVLPSDEVLSQVLFGRSASQLSPAEAAQLASALSGLASGGGLDVIGNLQSFARLDRLAFAGGDSTSGLAVSGGKYITENVYLELTGGGREGPSAQVEWRVRRTLSIVSKLAGTGDSKLSVRWRHDYGKPATAK